MKRTIRAALFGGAIFSAGIAQANDTYRIDGPSTVAAPSSGGYAWDGAYMSGFRGTLHDYNLFSHYFATVDANIITGDFDYLNVSILRVADCIISPWWLDSDITFFETYAAAHHFIRGGDLILLNDSSYADAIGQYLGVPTINNAAVPGFTGTGFPFDGPFGVVGAVNTAGSVGHLDPADVALNGGQVLATNAAGQITAAFWERDAFGPGTGKMIIVTDVNSIGDFAGTAQYFPLNDNGRFALNLVAGMIADTKTGGADCDKNGVLNIDDIDCFVDSFLNGEL